MQFSIVALLSIVAVAAAMPAPLVVRSPQLKAEDAAMTDASGAVVAFDSANVVKTG